jgi:hypothetical protein
LVSRAPAEAATITISYAAGHRDVTINGYGTPALGTFTLRDADEETVALCVEADSSHTTIRDAYSLVPNRVSSPELDALLWMLGDGTALDANTATAAAALAWYYADAQRNIGVPVWADGTRALSVHRLVQDVMRSRLGDDARTSQQMALRLTLNNLYALAGQGPVNGLHMANLVPHGLAVLEKEGQVVSHGDAPVPLLRDHRAADGLPRLLVLRGVGDHSWPCRRRAAASPRPFPRERPRSTPTAPSRPRRADPRALR